MRSSSGARPASGCSPNRLAPSLAEALAVRKIGEVHFDKVAAARTPGSLLEPRPDTATVSEGWRGEKVRRRPGTIAAAAAPRGIAARDRRAGSPRGIPDRPRREDLHAVIAAPTAYGAHRMPSPPNFLAAFDSASVMIMATAAYLRGEPFPVLGNPPAMKPVVKATGLLPTSLRQKAFIASGALETVSPRRMSRLDVEEVSEWFVGEYPHRRYPAVAVGSSNGAMVNLYTALGMPWLPQTFLIPVRQRVHPDNPTGALEAGKGPGRDLVEVNPDITLHHMHDAVQDRMMIRVLTYFRYKRRTLGPAYERFLTEHLAPGGEILVVECRTDWGTTRVGPRHVYQHGAIGGATEDEFHHGSDRVADYLARHDSPVRAGGTGSGGSRRAAFSSSPSQSSSRGGRCAPARCRSG